jgi:hypothetical protein
MKPISKIALVVCSATLLAACEPGPNDATPDQCLRAELFQQCMKALPAGPQATKYNDWDEVIVSCERVAFYQSLRPRNTVSAECRIDR